MLLRDELRELALHLRQELLLLRVGGFDRGLRLRDLVSLHLRVGLGLLGDGLLLRELLLGDHELADERVVALAGDVGVLVAHLEVRRVREVVLAEARARVRLDVDRGGPLLDHAS